jgi:uncharacterized protein
VSDDERALRDLRALYAEVDSRYADARCPATSECCRFGMTGREPQVTSVEVALLRRALAVRGGMLSKRKRALPLTANARAERICPLLDQRGRCAVYHARPLGCRTFYCARAELDPPARAELRGFVHALQAIAVRHQRDGDRPRALTTALAAQGAI